MKILICSSIDFRHVLEKGVIRMKEEVQPKRTKRKLVDLDRIDHTGIEKIPLSSKEQQLRRRKEMRRRRKRRQKIRKLLGGTVAGVMVLCCAGWVLHAYLTPTKSAKQEEQTPTIGTEITEKQVNPTVSANETEEVQSLGNAESRLTPEDKQEAIRIYQLNPQLLVLVNKDHELAKDYQAGLRSICNKRLKASNYIYKDLANMLEAGANEGHSFWIASAYRSRQRQQALINEDVRKFKKQGMSEEEALAKTLEETMPAGYSEHETGLALDILDSNNMKMDQTQENYEGNQWLRDHCHEFGFILRYPKEKEGITLISYEPWHLRYVGMEAAAYMKAHDLTLEEFHQLLELGN